MLLGLKLNLHKILLLVGPKLCGKTYFSEVMKESIKTQADRLDIGLNTQIISFDSIQLEISGGLSCGSKFHTYDLMLKKLEILTSFPVNAHFVIIDSRGLNDDFRSKVKAISRANNYSLDAMVFDYSDAKDYKRFSGDVAITKSIVKFRSKMGFGLDGIHMIRIMEPISEVSLEIPEIGLYKQCILDPSKKYLIIGDIHECLDEMICLLREYGFKVENGILSHSESTTGTEIISVGDVIDKGCRTAEIIEFLHSNLNSEVKISYVMGNHEDYARRVLTEGAKWSEDDLISVHFSGSGFMMKNPTTKRRFLEVFRSATPFLIYIGDKGSRSFYVTHSPCLDLHLGKLDDISIKRQITLKIDSDDRLSAFELANVNSGSFPLHISGHVTLGNIYNGLDHGTNKIGIDTGCIYGNKLSGIVCGFGVKNPRFLSQKFLGKQKIFGIERVIEREEIVRDGVVVDQSSGIEVQAMRLMEMVNSRVNYIPGTMSPSSADGLRGELESSRKAILYFYDIFQRTGHPSRLSIQPKFSGERVNVYLFRDEDLSYVVDRKGLRIGGMRLYGVYSYLLGKCGLDEFMRVNGIKMMIVDAMMCGSDLKAFGIVKIILMNGDEYLPGVIGGLNYDLCGDQIKIFELLNRGGEDQMEVCFDNDNFSLEEVIELADRFFEEIGEGVEGVVVKPAVVLMNVAPSLKVRKEEVLRGIYVDYDLRLNGLILEKSVESKMKASILEFKMGLELLGIKYENIGYCNEAYVKVISGFMGREEKNKAIDQRL